MPILVQLPLGIAGVIAGYFVSRDTLHFTLVQTGIALVMLAIFCAVLINARRIRGAIRSMIGKPDDDRTA
ncbi:hypothetical protein [Rhizobium sp. RAF56]|jgi:hypothetical protein|uniref:hypothetical protein n=1 Tax=Rhizobium sp. RAF56 TaxID=3233062 RepID=UPI003F98D2DA